MTTCGLWLAKRRLVAVLVGPRDEPRRLIRSALTPDARFGLLEYLVAAGTEVVAAEALARGDLLPQHAARRGLVVWTAGDGLVAAPARLAPPPRATGCPGATAPAYLIAHSAVVTAPGRRCRRPRRPRSRPLPRRGPSKSVGFHPPSTVRGAAARFGSAAKSAATQRRSAACARDPRSLRAKVSGTRPRE